jgi:hypothetical protein
LGTGLATLHRKKSLVKKAQGRACQTTVRRQNNWKKTNEIRLFTWNVLSLFRPGSLRMLTDIHSDYGTDITAIQELRWLRSGVMQKCDFYLYYSCRESKHIHIFGTGFVVKTRISHMVIGFEPLGMRMLFTSEKQSL